MKQKQETSVEVPINFLISYLQSVAYPGILFGGVQKIQLMTEDRENGVWTR